MRRRAILLVWVLGLTTLGSSTPSSSASGEDVLELQTLHTRLRVRVGGSGQRADDLLVTVFATRFNARAVRLELRREGETSASATIDLPAAEPEVSTDGGGAGGTAPLVVTKSAHVTEEPGGCNAAICEFVYELDVVDVADPAELDVRLKATATVVRRAHSPCADAPPEFEPDTLIEASFE